MYNTIYSINGTDYVRVSRRCAINAFANGVAVAVAPRNIRNDSIWCGFIDFRFTEEIAFFYSNPDDAFIALDNNFQYYNGHARYYLPLDEVAKYRPQ